MSQFLAAYGEKQTFLVVIWFSEKSIARFQIQNHDLLITGRTETLVPGTVQAKVDLLLTFVFSPTAQVEKQQEEMKAATWGNISAWDL